MDYVTMKMQETFGNIYNVINSKPEKFNSLDRKCIHRKVDDYHFTFRQSRPGL